MTVKNSMLFGVLLYSLIEVHRRFGGTYCRLYPLGFLHGLLVDPEGGGSMFLRNDVGLLPEYTKLHPRKQYPSKMLSLFY
jgi:hypothetical protein